MKKYAITLAYSRNKENIKYTEDRKPPPCNGFSGLNTHFEEGVKETA